MAAIIEKTVTIRKQVVAPQTVIEWDSATNTGTITFHTKHEVSEDGAVVGYEPGPVGTMRIDLAELLPLTLDVQGTPVPAVLVMGAVKAAFEHFLAQQQ